MTLAKQIERIAKLTHIDRAMAQKEADIAMRSAPSTRAANALRAEFGLWLTIVGVL